MNVVKPAAFAVTVMFPDSRPVKNEYVPVDDVSVAIVCPDCVTETSARSIAAPVTPFVTFPVSDAVFRAGAVGELS